MIAIHAIGDWGEGRVHVEYVAGSRIVIPQVEQIIDEQWTLASKRLGSKLFDGPMCRLEHFAASPDELRLKVSRTSYRVFLGTNLMSSNLADRFGEAVLANSLGVSCNLLTRDNWLMLGRRNSSVAYYPERVHPFAGCLEPREPLDVFDEARRELREELSLSADDLEQIRCVGIVEDRLIHQPELIFNVRCRRARSEIEAALDAAEHRACVAVENSENAIREFAADPALTPIAVVALRLARQ